MEKYEQNDKLTQVLHATEHPEEYTDEELRQLLDDGEGSSYYRLMCDAVSAYTAVHRSQEPKAKSQEPTAKSQNLPASRWRLFAKIAASVVFILLISGLTFAALYEYRSQEPTANSQKLTANSQQPTANSQDTKVYTFENAELCDILSALTTFYDLQLVCHNEESLHVRLYIRWDKTESAQAMVDRLNSFQTIHLVLDHDVITVE